MNATPRRRFLATATQATAGLAATAAWPTVRSADAAPAYRAAIIGHTGDGDYGHGYDRVFADVPSVTVVAIADPDPAGLEAAAVRAGAQRRYRDYREMLEREKPDLVAITPRHPQRHLEMARAALESARGLFFEKPMTATVPEADAIVEAARHRHAKIVVAHNRRWTPEFVQVKSLIAGGLIGTVLDVRIQGKQDARAGGEDLIVLGTHDFDLMRFYFGDPLWCLASVTVQDRPIAGADVHLGREPIAVAGDTVRAMFGFANQVAVTWHSVKTRDGWNALNAPREKWGFEIHGTQGIIAYQSGYGFAWLRSPFLAHKAGELVWTDLPAWTGEPLALEMRQPIRSLIRAIETDGESVCTGEDGRWTVEMVQGIYEAQRTAQRIAFPLKDRQDPLARL